MSKIVGTYDGQEQAESAIETFEKCHPDFTESIKTDPDFKPESESKDKEP